LPCSSHSIVTGAVSWALPPQAPQAFAQAIIDIAQN
jgi:hypothetical protein